MINISKLPQGLKRELWNHIESNHPDTALMLTCPFAEIIKKFDGSEIMLPITVATEDLLTRIRKVQNV